MVSKAILTRCVWTFGWLFVPCKWLVVTSSDSSTELVILFSLAFRRFSTEAYTSFEVLQWVVEIGRNLGYTKWDKKNNPQLNLCASLADSYSSSQATTASEIEGRSWRGVWGHRVRQTAVGGSQKRLTSCFRELEVVTQQHKKLPKSQNSFISRAGEPSAMATSPMKKRLSPKACCSPGGWLFICSWDVPETPAEEKITFPL